MPLILGTSSLPPLPPHKTVVQVFADFLAYLAMCAHGFIKSTHITLARGLDDLIKTSIYVMGHPNGWGGAQQGKMRQAAIMAGLIPDSAEGRSRVKFVTEGEAALHFCIKENVVEMVRPIHSVPIFPF